MALIPILEIEERVQLNDKTRLSAVKSFAPTGDAAITTMTLKPGADASEINIFNATAANRFLDWAYDSLKFDISTYNNKIYFEVSDVEYTATLTSGTYTLTTLLDEIDTQMSLASGATFTLTSDEKDKITIVCSLPLALNGLEGPANLLPHIGFKTLTTSSTTQVGLPVEYGIRTVTLSVNNGGVAVTKSYYQKVYSENGDALFCNDSDLTSFESDILKWVPAGRASFLNMARKAQDKILEWLDQNGYTDNNGQKYTKFAMVDISEVKPWAIYLTLELIYRSIHNSVDDVFRQKAKDYAAEAVTARNRVVIRLDTDGDGDIDLGDTENSPDSWSGRVLMR